MSVGYLKLGPCRCRPSAQKARTALQSPVTSLLKTGLIANRSLKVSSSQKPGFKQRYPFFVIPRARCIGVGPPPCSRRPVGVTGVTGATGVTGVAARAGPAGPGATPCPRFARLAWVTGVGLSRVASRPLRLRVRGGRTLRARSLAQCAPGAAPRRFARVQGLRGLGGFAPAAAAAPPAALRAACRASLRSALRRGPSARGLFSTVYGVFFVNHGLTSGGDTVYNGK